MKQKLITYTLIASLLTAPLLFGCNQRREHREPKQRMVYQVQTKDWGVKVEEKYGRKTAEAYKDGYRIRIEERKDGDYNIQIKILEKK